MRRTTSFFLACTFTGGLQAAAPDPAASYPERPIRLVLPYPPGGNTDILARAVGPRLTESWGRPVVVDARGGGNGVIAAEIVARSVPDGHTLFISSTRELSINPALMAKLPYHPEKDFVPITQGTISPIVAAAHPSFGPRTVKDLIDLARSKSNALAYASPGIATSQHLTGELFNLLAKVTSVHVPYKGGGPSVLAVVAGQEVQLGYLGMGPAIPHIRSGRLRGIAITTAKRHPQLPDLPTMIESGLDGYETSVWFAFFAPTGTPQSVIAKLNAELNRVLRSKEVNDFLVSTGVDVAPGTAAELARFVRADNERYARVIRAANVKAD